MKHILNLIITFIEYEIAGIIAAWIYSLFRPIDVMDYLNEAVLTAMLYGAAAYALKLQYARLRAERPKMLPAFILSTKLGGILLSAVLVLAYGFLASGRDILLFALLVVLYYIGLLVGTSVFYIRLERKS